MSLEQAAGLAKSPEAAAPLAPVVLWMTGALFAFCGIAMSLRGLAPHAGVFEVNAVRTGGGLLVLLVAMLVTGMRPRLPGREDLILHGARNAIHWVASLLWTASVTLLPLATVFALEFTTPIWVAVFSAMFLASRITGSTAIGLVMGMIGVLVVLRPSAESFDHLTVLPLAAAAFLAGATLFTQRLTRRNAVLDILFWMMALQFGANMAVLAWTGSIGSLFAALAGNPEVAGMAAALVASGIASQLCLTQALRTGNAVMVVSIDFFRIPLVAVIGYFVYAENVGLHTFIGSIAIVIAVAIITAERQPKAAGN